MGIDVRGTGQDLEPDPLRPSSFVLGDTLEGQVLRVIRTVAEQFRFGDLRRRGNDSDSSWRGRRSGRDFFVQQGLKEQGGENEA